MNANVDTGRLVSLITAFDNAVKFADVNPHTPILYSGFVVQYLIECGSNTTVDMLAKAQHVLAFWVNNQYSRFYDMADDKSNSALMLFRALTKLKVANGFLVDDTQVNLGVITLVVSAIFSRELTEQERFDAISEHRKQLAVLKTFSRDVMFYLYPKNNKAKG